MSPAAGQVQEESYWVRRTPRLLRGFDWIAPRVRTSLAARHGEVFAAEVLQDARLEFERIIPELPYIGGRRNPFTWVIAVNGWLVAFHRALRRRERPAEETIAVAVEVSDRLFRSVPRWVLAVAGRLAFTRPARSLLARAARRSQVRRHPADFVYTFEETGPRAWELRFSECAVNKFLQVQKAEELAPYCNFFDVVYSRLMGMGVDATETIGRGCATCRLRYQHGRETIVPAPLRGLLPDRQDAGGG